MKSIKIFEIEKKPRKGLLAIEWIILGYMVLTLLLALFMSTKIHDINPMIWGRFRTVMMMLGLWVVYRLIPCRFTMFARIALQLLLLGIWYPETFEFNRHFPNLDHLFATHEQSLCGCQPALLFSQAIAHPVFSELMHLGYSSYFPLIAIVTLFYFFKRYDSSSSVPSTSITSSSSFCQSRVRSTIIWQQGSTRLPRVCSRIWATISPPTWRKPPPLVGAKASSTHSWRVCTMQANAPQPHSPAVMWVSPPS